MESNYGVCLPLEALTLGWFLPSTHLFYGTSLLMIFIALMECCRKSDVDMTEDMTASRLFSCQWAHVLLHIGKCSMAILMQSYPHQVCTVPIILSMCLCYVTRRGGGEVTNERNPTAEFKNKEQSNR